MSRISIETITQELATKGWKVVSKEYTNLKTEMEFECAEGHPVFSTWGRIRQRRICPVCEQNKFKDPKPIIKAKKTGVSRILALDQASHVTGWAIFDGENLVQYGSYKTGEQEEMERLHEVNVWLISMIQNWQPDIVGIEGIQYQKNFGVTVFQTLARLQGILAETCRQANIAFRFCPTNTWRAHCGVQGRARADKKKSMQLLVKNWYDVSVSDDCADAIGIGKYVAESYAPQVEIVQWE